MERTKIDLKPLSHYIIDNLAEDKLSFMFATLCGWSEFHHEVHSGDEGTSFYQNVGRNPNGIPFDEVPNFASSIDDMLRGLDRWDILEKYRPTIWMAIRDAESVDRVAIQPWRIAKHVCRAILTQWDAETSDGKE